MKNVITESQLKMIVRESVERILNEYSKEEQEEHWRNISKSYNHAGPYRAYGNVDLYHVGNGDSNDAVFFGSKKEALDWVKTYITDTEQAQMLISALQKYVRKGGGRFITEK